MFKSTMSRSRSGDGYDDEEEDVERGSFFPRSGSLPNTNAKLKSAAMSATVSSKPIMPNYNLHNSIDDFEFNTTTPLIRDLLDRNKIQIASKQKFNNDINILNNIKSLILCHVVPNKIIDNVKYVFEFDLLFGPYQNVKTNDSDNDNDNDIKNNIFNPQNFEQVYYYYTLNIS
eukprot:285362_1